MKAACGIPTDKCSEPQVSKIYKEYQKADIETEKADIETKKADINVLQIYGVAMKDFTLKTVEHIQKMFASFGIESVSGHGKGKYKFCDK